MTLDANNPTVPDTPVPKINPDYLAVQRKLADAATKHAEAAATMAQASSGEPVTEGGLYASFLRAVLTGRLVGSSNDAQIWATDLTRDYLAKYDLQGNPRPSQPNTP
jgi:hypothetical protein